MNGLQAQQKELLLFIERYYSAQSWAVARLLDSVKERDVKRRYERLAKRKMAVRLDNTPFGDVWRIAPAGLPVLGICHVSS